MKKYYFSRTLTVTFGILSMLSALRAQSGSTPTESNPLRELNNSVRTLVQRVSPSVVHLIVTGYGPVESGRGNTSLVLGRQQSVGSGVIIDSNGYIVTNAHMVFLPSMSNDAYRSRNSYNRPACSTKNVKIICEKGRGNFYSFLAVSHAASND